MGLAALPEQPKLKVSQTALPATAARLAREEHVLVVLPYALRGKTWSTVPFADDLRKLLRRVSDKSAVPAVSTRLPNAARTGLSLAFLKPDSSVFACLTLARKLVADALRHNPARIAVVAPGLADDVARRLAESIVAATLAAVFEMPSLKAKPRPLRRLRGLRLYGLRDPVDLDRQLAEAEGNNLARWLAALPSNELTMRSYRSRIETLAQRCGWETKFLDERTLKRRGAGAFLAVASGNSSREAGIVHLRYRPRGGARTPALSLVGKGICFDTGGVNLKGAAHMQHMHEDMEGSAVALGTLLALTRLGAKFTVDCWLAVTENCISATAYKPHDVVTASNGVSIEVIHTDAEGRMALADALVLAGRESPRLIVDFATLTGACVAALTSRYSGAFTNREHLRPSIEQAGRESGERVWAFPQDPDFDEILESDIADIKQCNLDARGDHIVATRFLSRFVPASVPWVHVDLSASRHKGGLAHIPTDVTGFGVRFAVNWLLDASAIRPLLSASEAP